MSQPHPNVVTCPAATDAFVRHEVVAGRPVAAGAAPRRDAADVSIPDHVDDRWASAVA